MDNVAMVTEILEDKPVHVVTEFIQYACRKLYELGEDSVCLFANVTLKKMNCISSPQGSEFMAKRGQLLEEFYAHCCDAYFDKQSKSKKSLSGTEIEKDAENIQFQSRSRNSSVEQVAKHTRKRGRKPTIEDGVKDSHVCKDDDKVKNSDKGITLQRGKREVKQPKWAQSYLMDDHEYNIRKRSRSAVEKSTLVSQRSRSKVDTEDDEINGSEVTYDQLSRSAIDSSRSSEVDSEESDTRKEKEAPPKEKTLKDIRCATCKNIFSDVEVYNTHVCNQYSCNKNIKKKVNKPGCESSKEYEGANVAMVNVPPERDHEISADVSDVPVNDKIKQLSDKVKMKNLITTVQKIGEMFGCENCEQMFDAWKLYNQHKERCKVGISRVGTANPVSDSSQNPEDLENNEDNVRGKNFNANNSQDNDPVAVTDVDDVESKSSKMHGSKIKDLACQECNRRYRKRSSLTRHLKSVHDLLVFFCHCSKKFFSSEELEKHCVNGHGVSKQSSVVTEKNSENNDRYEDADSLLGDTGKKDGKKNSKTYVTLAERKKFKCELCDVMFTTMKNLQRHMKNIHKEKEGLVSCDECGKGFVDDWRLKYHLRHDHKHLNLYGCETCPQSFHTAQTFRRHKKKCDGSDKPEEEKDIDQRTCRICLKVLLTVGNLKSHLKSHEDKPDLTCEICHKKFVNLPRLKYHYDLHKKTLDKKFPCPHCNKAFLISRYLLRHLLTIHKEKAFVCKTCGKVCKNVQDLSTHVLQTHGPDDPNQPKRFPNGKSPSQFICETCGKIFKQKAALKNHIGVHGNERPYKCDKCTLTFKSFGTLSVHKRYRHRTFKAYQCELCGECFKMPDTLRCHRKTHEKPKYNCEFCNRDFRSLDGFKYHMLLQHKTDQGIDKYQFRIFTCSFCSKMFGHKSNYDYHIRTHTGSRPYKCEQCDKAFPVRSKLNLHMRRHTGEKMFKCEMCNISLLTRAKYQKHLRTAKHKEKEGKHAAYQPENLIDNTTGIETVIDTMETTLMNPDTLNVKLDDITELQDVPKTCVIDLGQQSESYVISVDNYNSATELVESLGHIYHHEQAQVLNPSRDPEFDHGQNLSEVEQIIEISIPYHVLPVPGYSQVDQESVDLESVSAVQGIQQ